MPCACHIDPAFFKSAVVAMETWQTCNTTFFFFFFKYGIIIFRFILSFFCCLAFPSVIILNECGVWQLCNEKSKLFAWFLSSETNFGNYKRFSNSGELAVSNGLLWQTHWWPINCSQNEIEPLTVLLTASQIRFIFTVIFTIYIV